MWIVVVVAMALAGCGTPVPRPLPVPAGSGGPPVVVTLGDSVPAGTACDCDAFPELYAGLLRPAAVSVNESRSGYTSADVRGELAEPAVRAALAEASVVMVMAGANDLAAAFDDGRGDSAYRSAADTVEQNVGAIVTTIRGSRTPGPVVLVLGYWNVVKDGAIGLAAYGADGERSAVQATEYADAALRRAAAASGARYVTTTSAFTGDTRDQDPTALLAADGDHPNARGHQAIARVIYAAQPTL